MKRTAVNSFALACAVSLTGATLMAATAPAGALSTASASSTRAAVASKTPYASMLWTRKGTDRIVSDVKGLPLLSHGTATSMLDGRVQTPKFPDLDHVGAAQLYGLAAGAGDLSPNAARKSSGTVRITGTFSVTSMPSHSTIQVLVLACPGGTTYGPYCGTPAAPAWLANQNFIKGSDSTGTYDFGSIPTSATGWQLGIILFDGMSNGGYYPASTPVLVAKASSTTAVSQKLTMPFVVPEISATFSVGGAPSGYKTIFEAVACPSSVTPDQLILYESFGACAIAETLGGSSLPLYVTPGSWTVRVFYAPYRSGTSMFAASDVIASKFDLVGPTVSVASEASSVTAATTTSYVTPSVVGSVAGHVSGGVSFSALVYVDPVTNQVVAGTYANASAGALTSFQGYFDPGTYVPYTEVVPFTHFSPQVSAAFVQVILRQAGPAVTIGSSGAAQVVKYALTPIAVTVHGGFAIPGLPDPANAYGEDNAYPLSYVIVCPGSEPFSPECSNQLLVSSTMLLGGTFNLYGVTGGATMAFAYTSLSGDFIVGAPVTVPASPTAQDVTLDAPYRNPTIWGQITISGPNSSNLSDVWLQACPDNEAFDVTCAGGISQELPNYYNQQNFSGPVQFGYGMDLPHGGFNLAVVGSTDPNFATDQRLGPTRHLTIGGHYPVVDFTASA